MVGRRGRPSLAGGAFYSVPPISTHSRWKRVSLRWTHQRERQKGLNSQSDRAICNSTARLTQKKSSGDASRPRACSKIPWLLPTNELRSFRSSFWRPTHTFLTLSGVRDAVGHLAIRAAQRRPHETISFFCSAAIGFHTARLYNCRCERARSEDASGFHDNPAADYTNRLQLRKITHARTSPRPAGRPQKASAQPPALAVQRQLSV